MIKTFIGEQTTFSMPSSKLISKKESELIEVRIL